MGAKFNMCYLIKEENDIVLKKVIEILHRYGFRYNQYALGEYTYWLDGPIWEFGDSKTIKEKKLVKTEVLNDVNKIVEKFRNVFSPIMKFSLLAESIIQSTLSICELESDWKELKFSVDRYQIYDRFDDKIKREKFKLLEALFLGICNSVSPYYGMGATEFKGVVNIPEELEINCINDLGDFNFFLDNSKLYITEDEYTYKFKKIALSNKGIFLVNKNNTFDY